jgi:hypothetical protein
MSAISSALPRNPSPPACSQRERALALTPSPYTLYYGGHKTPAIYVSMLYSLYLQLAYQHASWQCRRPL